MQIPDDTEKAMGLKRPLRLSYAHAGCAARKNGTTISKDLALELAADPMAHGVLKCNKCNRSAPAGEFRWYNPDGTLSDEVVGS